jgi:lysophospholipase L1-like esterase
MRIVFLGDSLTWGGYGGDFVSLVAAKLPEHDILNEGVGGDTVVNLLRRADDVVSESLPDVMFVMVGGNDAVSYTYPAVRPYYKSVKKLDEGYVTPDQFTTAYRDLLLYLQSNRIQTLVGLAGTEYNAELAAARDIYNARAREVAESLNIPVLDFTAILPPAPPVDRPGVTLDFVRQIGARAKSGWNDYEAERAKWGYTHTFDGMHLLPQTAILFADAIVAFLKEHVL